MSNVRGSTRETEKGKILLKSNWRMNEREQEKIDAKLETSSEEESEKQQGETGTSKKLQYTAHWHIFDLSGARKTQGNLNYATYVIPSRI